MGIENAPLVGPVLALAGWTMIMEIWLYTYRIPDIQKYKIPIDPNGTTASFNARIPRHRQWPADNYNHLHEQPTVFYAVALALTVAGVRDLGCVRLAWGYVGARVVHSLIQALRNDVMKRFVVFLVSSCFLGALVVRGGLKVL